MLPSRPTKLAIIQDEKTKLRFLYAEDYYNYNLC